MHCRRYLLYLRLQPPLPTVAVFATYGCSLRYLRLQGLFHEALNMAAIWQLPVLFVCENNQVGLSTDIKDVRPCNRI